MKREEIEYKLDRLLNNKFDCSNDMVEMMKTKRFLSKEVGFSAISLFELFLEIEREFNIHFSQEDIMKIQFDDYNALLHIIKKKEGEKI